MQNHGNGEKERVPLFLRDWAIRLEKAPIKEDEKRIWYRQLRFFFSYCRRERGVACVATCRAYLEHLDEKMPKASEYARPALRWFVKEARLHGQMGS